MASKSRSTLVLAAAGLFGGSVQGAVEDERVLEAELPDDDVPFLVTEDLPPRIGPLIELGRGINEGGALAPGIEMPWGAVWQPGLWVYGSQRVAAMAHDGDRRTRPHGDHTELSARMDLFANLQLSGTERIQAHLRPLDSGSRFTGRTWSPSSRDTGFERVSDTDFESFFEGNIGQMLPWLDPDGRGGGDVGFAVGRFPVEFQNGYMVRDEMTGVALTRTHIQVPGSSGVRIMGLWAFDDINRANNAPEPGDVELFGLFAEGDFPWGLLEADVARTVADAPRAAQLNTGLGWTGHSGGSNYSMHLNVSRLLDGAVAGRDTGSLVVLGYSTEVGLRRDIVYANGYWADGDYRRLASSGPPPLGPIGLSFGGVGLGGYRPALLPRPLDSAGVALGWQRFFAAGAANFAIEVGHRQDLASDDPLGNTGGTAVTVRVQRKLGHRYMLQLDGYRVLLAGDSRGPQDAENDDDSGAVTLELRVNF